MADSGELGVRSASASIANPDNKGVEPFRRSPTRGAAELLADALIGADASGKTPWWLKAGGVVLAAAGVSATLVWSWFASHAVYVLGPAFLGGVAAFFTLLRGARQREKRLVSEVDRHTHDQVEKARQEIGKEVARRMQLSEKEVEAALAAEWNESNPLARLIRPNVFFVFLTGSVIRVTTSICNVYYLPRMLRCTSCTVLFRRRDSVTGQFTDISTASVNAWSAEIPAGTTQYQIPQPNPVSIPDSEGAAIRKARDSGLLDVHVSAQYAVMVGMGSSAHEVSHDFQFRALLVDG